MGHNSNAQYYDSALSVTGGYVQDGFGANINYNHRVNDFDYVEVGLQANFSNLTYDEVEVPMKLLALNAGFYFDIIRNNRRLAEKNKGFAISLGAGAQVGLEKINDGEVTLSDTAELNFEPSQIVIGGFAGANIDYFLNSKLAIALKITETYHFNSNVGSLSPYAGLGLKFIFI